MQHKRIIDISPMLSERIAVFPGDRAFQRQVSMDLKKGDALSLSSITTTVHLGAHADAPSHYSANGQSIDQRKLELYLGPCQVLRLSSLQNGQRIQPSDLGTRKILAPRVLFYTGSFSAETWTNDFNALSPELIAYLYEQGVVLVGIDTPSVDTAESKALETHAAIARYDLAVLEGLVLDHVDEGLYQLIALPLKIEEGDASPVRAVLLA